jgi:hypothetical protein
MGVLFIGPKTAGGGQSTRAELASNEISVHWFLE